MARLPNQPLVGAALMIVGTLLFVPGAGIGASSITVASLVVAAGLLTAGTLLIGTSESGRPV